MEILSHFADHLYYQFLLVDSLFSRGFTKLLPPSDVVHTSSWTSIDKFRLQFVSTLYLLFLYMATHTTDGVPRMIPALSSMTPTDGTNTHLQPDDPTSASYIPRVARMTPTSTTVHTIFIKKLSYPLTSRPDELWILERTADGRETWKPVETFLENMHLTRDRATLRTTANHWRQYYEIPIQSSNHPPPLQQHPSRFYHIPNIPTSTSHSRTRPSLTNFTFSNRAGDALLNITHKVPLFLYLGHHGDLHHRLHHRQHFTGPYTPTTLLHLFIILIAHHLRMNQALWICQTPACNLTPRFAKRKAMNSDFVAIYGYLMVHIFFFLFFVFLFTVADNFNFISQPGLPLITRRHGAFFSSSSISRYIHG